MKQPLSLLPAALAALALAAAPVRAVSPQGAFDTCTGGELVIHVTGWAYDPDVPAQSIDVNVGIYTDSNCSILYTDTTLTADVPRLDVNRVKGIGGDHGFDADIPVPAGTYWVEYEVMDRFMRTFRMEKVAFYWDGQAFTFQEASNWKGIVKPVWQ